jgi:hypothetical protein
MADEALLGVDWHLRLIIRLKGVVFRFRGIRFGLVVG